jgi:hypothetical protein
MAPDGDKSDEAVVQNRPISTIVIIIGTQYSLFS